MASKGKEKVFGGGGGKDDKTGGRKRKDRGVLQFFDDAAFEVEGDDDSSDDDLDIDDFLEDEFGDDVKANNKPANAPLLPFIKEEEMNEEELEKMVEERYGPGSSFVTYAEDGYESKRTTDRVAYASSSKDPTLWKVKCMVGRERHSTFCLMQKFVDLRSLGTKLQIISAFTLDHVKGFIYIEADKQYDVNEACKGLTSIYSSRTVPVPKNEISHVLSVRSKSHGITEGMWARVKNGKYKGDLAQVVAVNDARKKVTVKLIPRIDLRALAEKFGGGVTAKKASTPAPRLISSSELEEFRPLIQVRRDRDTNKMVQILDGMMLKDGYLYKKVSVDSLSVWGAVPTEDELLKFEPSNNDESNDLEWLSDLYGDRKKKRTTMSDKGVGKGGVGKGKGSSSSNIENNFEVHDLVFFGRKDFGVIVGMEKDDSFKIMKEGSEGPVVVTLPMRDLKNASFDRKLFTALDQHMKTISINDTVRVLDGPLKDREGIVKRIYKGTIFLYNESEQENNGHLCIKSQKCEKVTSPADESHEKASEPGPSGFGDFSSSPKSPLSPKKSWQGRDSGNSNREDKNGMFSVGQSLRIRVGPLKGYLCRVLAVRRSDVTVKLDSQQKILTVKSEHLSEVRGKSSGTTLGEDHGTLKPFDLLGTTDGSRDWMDGAGTTVESGSWNMGGSSTEGSGWPAFPASSNSLQPNSGAVIPSNTVDGDAEKGDSAWGIKPTSSQNPAWGIAGVDAQTAADSGQVDGWGKHEDGWRKAASTSAVATGTSDSWGKAVESHHESIGQGNSWGRDGENQSKKDDSSLDKAAWNSSESASEKQTGSWGNAGQPEASGWKKPAGIKENQTESWANRKNEAEGAAGWGNGGSSWGKTVESQDRVAAKKNQEDSWGAKAAHHQTNKDDSSVDTSGWKITADSTAARAENWNTKKAGQDGVGGSSWSKKDGGTSWSNKDGGLSCSKPAAGSSWGQQADEKAEQSHGRTDRNESWGKQSGSSWSKEDGGSSWSKQGGSSWGKQDGGSSSNRKDSGSSWSKPGGGSSWSQQADANAKESQDVTARNDNWGKQDGGSSLAKQGGGSSWNKPAGGSSWGQQGNAVNESKVRREQNDNWGKQEGGSSWSKQEGGSSWNNKQGGGSPCGQQADANAKASKDRTDQNDSWGKQEGGSSWSKPAGGSTWAQQADVNAEDQSKGKTNQNDSWSKQDGSSSWNKKDGGSSWNNQAGSSRDQSSGYQRGDNWNASNPSAGGLSSGWNKGSVTNDETSGGSGWGGKSNWDSQKASRDNSSAWNQKSVGNMKDEEKQDHCGGWNAKKTSVAGSSTGWGQSNQWNSGANNAGGDQNSAWSSKSNWSSGTDFGGSQEQADNSYRGRGRGGSWRGGRGGRGESDRCGFGGRDGSEQGGFGGRDGSERGGFGGRGRSERGGFGGRGRSDRGGFRGRGRSDRGGFGGRGRGGSDQYGDWNKRNDSGEDKTQSWYKSSDNADGGGNNEYKGSWNQGGADSGQWKSWSSGGNQLKGDVEGGGNAQAGWSRQENSWKTKDSTGGWNDQKAGWDQGSSSRSGSMAGTWNKPSDTDGGQAKQGNGAAEGEGPSEGNAQAGWSRQENSGKTSDATGGWNQGTSRSGSMAGTWSKPSGSDGGQAKEGNGAAQGEGPGDSWGKAAASSWGKANDGGW